MAPHLSSRITSVGFIGSGRLAESVARELIKKVSPQRKFCYQKQRLVSTLLASDPSQERRQVFDRLGFTTTEQNDEILNDCDVVFIGTSAREALQHGLGGASAKPRARLLGEQLRNRLFVALMGDLPADQVENLLYPGAKVIRMMPQAYLEQRGIARGLLPPSGWATARNQHASADDVKRVTELAGISTCLEVNEDHADLWAFNSGATASVGVMPTTMNSTATAQAEDGEQQLHDGDEDGDHLHVGPDFHDQYLLGKYLGTGRFAQVYKATHRETGEEFAVKCVTEDELTREARETLMAEVAALSRLNHPNVVAHHGFYSENDKYFLLLDYCELGSVSRLLRDGQRVAEPVAKSIIRQLLQALAYCHSMGLVHRDIKAENVLLTANTGDSSSTEPYQVKLADFGLSKELDLVSGYLQDMCGTPQYLSPEIVSGRTYAQPADIWSAGILSYMLLSGHVPFEHAASEAELFRDIRIGAIWYHQPGWQGVSPEAKAFVQSMLEISPGARPTAAALLEHKWLQS